MNQIIYEFIKMTDQEWSKIFGSSRDFRSRRIMMDENLNPKR